MPKVIFTHTVSDPALWASKHEDRVAAFAAWGTDVVDHQSADGKHCAVSVDVHDMDAMKASMETPEMAAAKQAHGVQEPVIVHIENS